MIWETQIRKVRIGKNDVGTFCIRETWAPFRYLGPFSTPLDAQQRAWAMADAYGYKVEIEFTEDNIAS